MYKRNHIRYCKHSYCWIVFLFLFLCSSLNSQISPVYDRHTNYEAFINPAIAGRDLSPSLSVSYKDYWPGSGDSPNSLCLGAMFRLGTFNFYTPDMMLNKTGLISRNRMGFGAFTMFENNGPLTYFTSQIAYAYFLPLSKYTLSELSFGLSLELSQFKIDENKLDPRDEGDPELTGLNDSYFYPESGFGIYYHNEQFQIGASVNELFQTPLPYDETALIQNKRDLFFQTGYKFYLKRFELEPSLLIARIDERPIYYYSQLKLFYLNYNWISLAYKSSHTITTAFGFRVRRMTIGYAYECNVSKLQRYFGGSHEIILGINVGLYEPSGIRKTVHIRK